MDNLDTIFSREFESMPREDLEQLQLERLQSTLFRVSKNVASYKKSLDDAKIDVEVIRTLEDLRRLPFTTKEDLRLSYPYNAFAVPLRDIVRVHSTSGTTGKPIVVGYTKTDLSNWASLVARVLTAAGVGSEDFVQIAFNYSLNTGGFGFDYGAERLGASVIPSAVAEVRRQLLVMKDYRSTALISTPGYALHIATVLRDLGMHPDELTLRVGLFGAEPWSTSMRDEIGRGVHGRAYDNYGLSEIIGPGVAFECGMRDGLHINEDHFIPEVVDPDTLEPVEPGEQGELVFTTITKQAFPLIRYRTGDISALEIGPCSCGRTTQRMQRVYGRTDDMIIVEGINVFPSQIEELLLEVEGAEPHYQITLDRDEGIDSMEIKVEVSPNLPNIDDVKELINLKTTIQDRLSESLGIRPMVSFVEPKTLERSSGDKINRVIDRRTK